MFLSPRSHLLQGFFFLSFYLKLRATEQRKGREKKQFPSAGSFPKLSQQLGLGWAEARSRCGSRLWMARMQKPRPSWAAFLGTSAGSWTEVGQLGLKPALLWDDSDAGSSSTFCHTMPATASVIWLDSLHHLIIASIKFSAASCSYFKNNTNCISEGFFFLMFEAVLEQYCGPV